MNAHHVTGGREARMRVFDGLHFAYQDSGLLGALMDGTLDATGLVPACGHVAGWASAGRNVAQPRLLSREEGTA